MLRRKDNAAPAGELAFEEKNPANIRFSFIFMAFTALILAIVSLMLNLATFFRRKKKTGNTSSTLPSPVKLKIVDYVPNIPLLESVAEHLKSENEKIRDEIVQQVFISELDLKQCE